MSTVLIQPPKAATSFDGLWSMAGQQEKLDNELVKNRMGLAKTKVQKADPVPPLHGTYTKTCYHQIAMRSGVPLSDKEPIDRIDRIDKFDKFDKPEKIENGILDIFDEAGNLAHFVWQPQIKWGNDDGERGAWQLVSEPITIQVSPDPKHPYLPKGATLVLRPSLSLTNSAEFAYPRNGLEAGAPYPLPSISNQQNDLPYQYIYYDPDTKTLVWARPDLKLRASFSQVPVYEEPTVGQTWNQLFVHSIPCWYFAFVGWDPSRLDNPIYRDDALTGSGTDQTKSVGSQNTHNIPIFTVPNPNSRACAPEMLGESIQAYIPKGTKVDYDPSEVSSAHTFVVSSQKELIDSWTTTFGLSAGIEKVLSISAKGSYGKSTEQHFENESRRSVSRRVQTDYRYFTNMPDLELAPDFENAIWARLHKLNVGNDLEWADFVKVFGTHYVHAITYGTTDFSETLYSLHAESVAVKNHFSLETEASAALDGVNFGGKAGATQDWGQKLGKSVSSQDVEHRVVGLPGKPAPIFLDLRPIWELFSPIFFKPDLDDKAPVAPFIWTQLRGSFQQYVRTQKNVEQSLDPSCFVSLKPRVMKISFSEFKVWVPYGKPCMYGHITLSGDSGAEQIDSHDWNVGSSDSKYTDQGSDLDGIGNVSLTCVIPATNFKNATYTIDFDLSDWGLHAVASGFNNKLTFQFCTGNPSVFEWHDSNSGYGHKIGIKVEEVPADT